jgi:tetratricopeptide (TPR) repeat protein
MGLIQPILTAIHQVVNNIDNDKNIIEIYNILGDLSWINGDIGQAIACQEKTITLATQELKSLVPQPENKHTVYYLRILEEAAKLFQQVIYLAQNTDHHRWAEKASVCLALTNSYLGCCDTAYALADAAYQNIQNEKLVKSGSFAYFIQILGQTYVNLGNFIKAKEMFYQALTFAEESHYMQVKAKTLNGLAEIYRQQLDYQLALNHHTQAIELLDKIGAKCDLAEAYFQLGLTYQKLGNNTSQIYLQQATQLFTEIKAPKQVVKIFNTVSSGLSRLK